MCVSAYAREFESNDISNAPQKEQNKKQQQNNHDLHCTRLTYRIYTLCVFANKLSSIQIFANTNNKTDCHHHTFAIGRVLTSIETRGDKSVVNWMCDV